MADEVTRLLADAEKLNADMPELFAVKGWFAIERKAYPEAKISCGRLYRATRSTL